MTQLRHRRRASSASAAVASLDLFRGSFASASPLRVSPPRPCACTASIASGYVRLAGRATQPTSLASASPLRVSPPRPCACTASIATGYVRLAGRADSLRASPSARGRLGPARRAADRRAVEPQRLARGRLDPPGFMARPAVEPMAASGERRKAVEPVERIGSGPSSGGPSSRRTEGRSASANAAVAGKRKRFGARRSPSPLRVDGLDRIRSCRPAGRAVRPLRALMASLSSQRPLRASPTAAIRARLMRPASWRKTESRPLGPRHFPNAAVPDTDGYTVYSSVAIV